MVDTPGAQSMKEQTVSMPEYGDFVYSTSMNDAPVGPKVGVIASGVAMTPYGCTMP